MTKEISPNKAKQGRQGRPVLVVLITGLLLAAVVWLVIEIYGSAIAPENPSGDPASVPTERLDPAPEPGQPEP